MHVLAARIRQQPVKNIEAVKKTILDNCRTNIIEVSDDVGISFGICKAISTAVLGRKHATAKIVPKLLKFEQKQHCIDIALETLTMFNDDQDLSKNLITGDKLEMCGSDIETKA